MQFKSTLTLAALMGATALSASIPSSCSIGTSATATAQADLDKYAGCETLVGNLTITGDLGSAALANVQEIQGSLSINNATLLNSFSADSVQTITGALNLEKLTVLDSASFGSLKEVDTINLLTLPAISTFASNLQSANNIIISDTSLESVDGFSSLKTVSAFNINNNRYLTSIKSTLQTVSDSLQVSFNGDKTAVSFDNLIWANNITLRSVSNASFASLENVNASFGFFNNSIESLKMVNLTKVGQTFTVNSNNDLTTLQCTNLTSVGGGFVIANNTALKSINGFPKLNTVGGAVVVVGNFSDLELPSLKSVRGGADFESKSGNFSCSPFEKLHSNNAIQGDKFVCKNGATSTSIKLSSTSTSSGSSKTSSGSTSATATSSDSSSSSTSSSSKSKGAAVAQFAPASGFMGAVAAIAVALL